MNTLRKTSKMMLIIALAIGSALMYQSCKKTTNVELKAKDIYDDKVESIIVPQSEVVVPLNFAVDTSYTHEKSHSNVNWKSRYYDFSDTWLTGRFGNFGFKPKFEFYQNDMTKCKLEFFINVSTANTSELGRDAYGKCGPNYFGVVYTDSNKTAVIPACDTAWYKATKFTPQGNGYLVDGTMTFNRYLPASGQPDGTPISKPMKVYLTYNGMKDFDANNDGTPDKIRCGFSAKFAFNRSDFMDKNSTKMYFPFPKAAEQANSDAALLVNKTYGVWSTSVADEMIVEVNHVFYKNH